MILFKIIVHTQKNINHVFLVVLRTKLFVLIINSIKKLFLTEEKMLFTDLLRQFLVIVGGDFNKSLNMSTEEVEERFQLANSC